MLEKSFLMSLAGAVVLQASPVASAAYAGGQDQAPGHEASRSSDGSAANPSIDSSAHDSPANPPAKTLSNAQALLLRGDYDEARAVYTRFAGEVDAGTFSSSAAVDDATEAAVIKQEAELGLARCGLATGDYQQAFERLGSNRQKETAGRHGLMAELLRRLGRYDDALQHLRDAIKAEPGHAGVRRSLGEMLEYLGRREEAIEVYRWFEQRITGRPDLPRDAAWLTDAAIGFYRYSVLTQSNAAVRTRYVLHEMLQVAYAQLDRTYVPARIAAADLLREKFNNSEEDGSVSDYQAALKVNPRCVEAHVGLGEVALEHWGFEEVERRAEQALQTNPNFAPAIHLLAKKLIIERRYEQAKQTCERALAINPNDLVALSLHAAAGVCRQDEQDRTSMQKRVEQINPKCALFHRNLGDALSGIRQYEASEREYLKAIQWDSTDANARTELGMMYMQWGLEDKAREALEAAWALDQFNERTKFTLDLLESLQKFDKVETEHFVVQYDAERDPGLGAFLADYLEEIYESVTLDFAYQPEHKTIIEVFPSQRAFAVRITGKPWIHTVGACTGRVIALASPRRGDDRMGPYNLADVLKHEFTHTVTLAATNNRIPHWLTEGLAVYQEDVPRPFDWWELLADAARRGRSFTLESINWGFMRPERPGDRQRAYAQSEWMVEYIVQRFGYDKIDALLQQFRAGHPQAEVFEQVLDIDVQSFERDFAAWIKVQLAQVGFDLTPPDDPDVLRKLIEQVESSASAWGRIAKAWLDAGEIEEARGASRKALAMDEREPVALEVLGMILVHEAQCALTRSSRYPLEEEAVKVLSRLRDVNPASWTGHKLLGEILLTREQWQEASVPLTELQRLCPSDPFSWRGLAGIYLKQGDEDRILEQLSELARIERGDAEVPAQIASILTRRKGYSEARYWLERSLFIDPFRVETHRALGDSHMRFGDARQALKSYQMLMILEPNNAEHPADAAFAAYKSGDLEQARALAEKAVQMDPHTPAASLLNR